MTASAMPPSSRARAAAATASAPISPRPSPISSKTCSAWPGQRGARRPRARRRSALQHGDHARGSVLRQDRADRRFRTRSPARPVRAPAPRPAPSRRPARICGGAGPRPPGAGLLHARAHLPGLSGPRPDDRGSVPVLLGLGPRDARAHAVGQHSRGRRGRHPHPPRRRRRGRRARRPAGRPLHFPVAGAARLLPARRRRPALPRADLDGDGRARRRIRGADHRQGQDAR